MNTKSIFKSNMTRLFALIFLFSLTTYMWADYSVTTPANLPTYYTSLSGKSGSTLFSAINSISTDKKRTTISKSGLWTAYQTTDLYPSGHAHEGKIWDIYSNCYYTYSTDQCGNVGSQACVCYNKEHSVPQNWLGSSDYSNEPAKDIVHIFPTDGKVNGVRSNYPYGETNAALLSTQYGSSALGRFGSSKLSSYSGDVYEPDDEYKGDLARVYMYMRAHYATWNIGQGTGSAHFSTTTDAASDSNFGMTAYSVELLMEWHRNDPVSQKEIDRNNGIETVQGNRNPFVDYPALAEYLWGTKKSTAFSFDDVVGSFDTENFIPGTSDGFKTSGTTTTLSFASASVVVTTGSTVSNPATTNSTCATISYSSSNTSVATVNSSGVITGVGDGTCTITASISACGDFSAKTVTCTVTVGTTVSVTWMANGSQFHQNTALSGSAPSLPNDTPDDCTDAGGKKFVGWIAEGGNPENYFTTTAPTISANTTFLAVYATASQSSGTTNASKTFTFSDIASANSWTNGTAYTSVEDAPVTLTANGGGNNGKYYTSDNSWRMYSGGSISISVADGSVTSVSSSPSQTFTISNGTASLSLSATVKFTEITVNYTVSGSTTTYSDFATSCSGAAITYATVTFYKNDGSATTTTQQVQQGNTANMTANPWTREHYTFLGWSTSSTATEATYSDGASYTFSADADLYAVWKEDDQYTVTWYVDGSSNEVPYYSGDALALPSTPSTCDNGRVFKGWTTTTPYTGDGTDLLTSISGTVTTNADYYAVFATASSGSGSGSSTTTVTDNLTNSNTINGTSSTYSSWTATDTSDAEYSGQSAGGNSAIQLRSNNSNSGVVTTTSGGTAAKVTLTWNSNTTNGRTVNVYGKTTAYSAPTDLYDTNTQGTLLGTIVYGTSTELEIDGDYTYVGLRSSNGALYLDEIDIDWTVTSSGGGGGTTYSDYSTACSGTTYTITWDATTNGGTCTTSETVVNAGSAVGTLPTAEKTGHSFNGWYTAATDGTKITASTVPTESATYYAQFTIDTYTITYNKGANGSGTVSSTTKTYGEDATLSANTFTREGYEQTGWSSNEDGSTNDYALGGTYSTNAAIALYPYWSALTTYTVTFKVGTETHATFEGWEGKSISGIATPDACAGYTFVGWSTQQYGTTNTAAPSIDYTGLVPGANTIYYAVFSTNGVAVGTTLWAENFAHFDSNTPSDAGSGAGTTVFGNATITYEQSADNNKGYAEYLAGGTSPELLLYRSSTTWTISGIPMANATALSLTFLSNKTTFSVTSTSDALTVSGSGKAWTITLTGATAPETFDLTITNTGSSNARLDNVELKVTAIDDQGAVFTTSKTFTITLQSPDSEQGTVSFE